MKDLIISIENALENAGVKATEEEIQKYGELFLDDIQELEIHPKLVNQYFNFFIVKIIQRKKEK